MGRRENDLYYRKLKYANRIGFATVADAMGHYGLPLFEWYFRRDVTIIKPIILDYPNNKQKIIPQKPKIKPKNNKYKRKMKNYAKPKQITKPEKSKSKPTPKQYIDYRNQLDLAIEFQPNYFIFNDGTVYSKHFGGKVLKQSIMRGKNNDYTKHNYIKIRVDGKHKTYFIARLVMFYYGNHKYKTIDEMPPVTYKDGNSSNLHINNLYFTTWTVIGQQIPQSKERIQKIPDNDFNRQFIKGLLDKGIKLKEIANFYNCSDMSVVRFKKRNNL